MADCRHNKAVTLIEMLVVLGIIVVLAGLVVALTLRVDNQSKERALDSAFSLVNSALREYYETKDKFPDQPARIVWQPVWTPLEYQAALDEVLQHIEWMVRELQSVPDSRRVLEQLDADLIRNDVKTAKGTANPSELRDPWGTLLDYVYAYDYKKNTGDTFPELISAGPDRRFGTGDDISSKGRQRR